MSKIENEDVIVMVQLIKDDEKCKAFTLDLNGLVMLMKQSTPCKASFEIQRVL